MRTLIFNYSTLIHRQGWPLLDGLIGGWLTTVGSKPSKLNIYRSLLLLTEMTCHDMLEMPKEYYYDYYRRLLYEHLTNITNSIGELIHKSIMKFKLIVLGFKVFNKSVGLILRHLCVKLPFCSLGDYFDFSFNNLFRNPKSSITLL